jgi:hypothetical protein
MPFAEGTPTVDITLDGKDYTLGYTLGAIGRARELGVEKIDVTDSIAFMLALPSFVWVCLDESGREELSVKQIAELVNPLNVGTVAEKIGELWNASVPEPDPNVQPPAEMTKPTGGNSTSKISGQLAATISA